MHYLSKIVEQHYPEILSSSTRVTWLVPDYQLANHIRHLIAKSSHKAIWSPRILTPTDWVQELTGYQIPSQLQLLSRLHNIAKEIRDVPSFPRFINWGKILLRDFNKIDENLLDGSIFFEKNWYKEENIRRKEPAHLMQKFHKEWQTTLLLYERYREQLIAAKYGYPGLLARVLYEKLANKSITCSAKSIITINLHPLSVAQQKILHLLDKEINVDCYYDVANYYMEDSNHSAGYNLRSYAKDAVLGRHLSPPYPQSIVTSPPTVQVFASTTELGQIAALSQQLQTIIKKEKLEEKLDQVAILLGDTSLLIPLLQSLPLACSPINLLTGYPLTATSLYRLSSLAINLYYAKKNNRSTIVPIAEAISSHPNIVAETKKIIQHTQSFPTATPWLFLKAFLASVKAATDEFALLADWEKIVLHHLILWCEELILLPDAASWSEEESLQFFEREAEKKSMPIKKADKGITIMHFANSQSLTARWVFVVGVQEGLIPPRLPYSSVIPRNWREKNGFSTTEQEEARYAYLFYRLLHNSDHLYLFYATRQKGNTLCEKSRYLLQLTYESPLTITEQHITPPLLRREQQKPFAIQKSKPIQAILNQFLATQVNSIPLTPSALNSYLACPVCFYFQYIARIPSPKKATEYDLINPMLFGRLLHKVLDQIYSPYVGQLINASIIAGLAVAIPSTVEQVVQAFPYQTVQGHSLLKEIITALVKKIIKTDEAYTPFTLVGTEVGKRGRLSTLFPLSDGRKILIGGIIDRIDRKGNNIRIIDYKTGGWDATIADMSDLFDGSDPRRNSIAMQLMTYAWLYQREKAVDIEQVMPMVMSSRTLFDAIHDGRFYWKEKGAKNEAIEDIRLYENKFEEALRKVLDELFDPSVPFVANVATEHLEKCRYPDLCRSTIE